METATIRAELVALYPQFSGLPDAQIDAAIEAARLMVPCGLSDARKKLAIIARACWILSAGASGSVSGAPIKREKSGDIEVEYAVATGQAMGQDYWEKLYQQAIGSRVRSSPMVLGYNG